MLTLVEWERETARIMARVEERRISDRIWEIRSRQISRKWKLSRIKGCLALIKEEALCTK
jgi:hypothetical protein